MTRRETVPRLRDQLSLLKEQAFGAAGGDHIAPTAKDRPSR